VIVLDTHEKEFYLLALTEDTMIADGIYCSILCKKPTISQAAVDVDMYCTKCYGSHRSLNHIS